ncbi:uncharacterized protein OCT59_027053 [Rhizophagus irregularis]|uniref:uncharacterized protein n=1 Tax=Rhizophagus irregularis TaxID=588596 RepID=UPI00331F8593|nr:hypothetical protein OCT59_027053 [Rhizophagus irregularis]
MEPSKINNTHSKDENINEEDKVANKVNTVTLNDFSDGDSGVYEDIILNQTHGLCPECNQPNTSLNWCKESIKSLNDSANITEDFLNEWKLYLKCQHKVGSEGSYIIPVLGITQHPDTLNYMAIIYLLPGNLRNNLPGIKYNPNDKFRILFAISIVLEAIHDSDLVHGDFHSGNILCWDNDPKKRQTASECKFKFAIWLFKYPPENDDEKRVPIPENEPKITYHPNSCYASRKITYSAKLNEHLAQDLLSYKIIIDDDEINENFDDCKI